MRKKKERRNSEIHSGLSSSSIRVLVKCIRVVTHRQRTGKEQLQASQQVQGRTSGIERGHIHYSIPRTKAERRRLRKCLCWGDCKVTDDQDLKE